MPEQFELDDRYVELIARTTESICKLFPDTEDRITHEYLVKVGVFAVALAVYGIPFHKVLDTARQYVLLEDNDAVWDALFQAMDDQCARENGQ